MRNLLCAMAVLVGVPAIIFANAATKPADGHSGGLTINLAVAEPKVPLGGDLKITVTLVNHTDQPITVARGALEFWPGGWATDGMGGGGLGNYIALLDKDATSDLMVPAKGSVTAAFIDREHTTVALGSMRCQWKLLARNAKLQADLGNPEPITVKFEVQPSQVLLSAWAAKSDRDRAKVLPAVKELLICPRTDSRQNRLIEETFDYLAGAALPLLDLAAKDGDPLVRAAAIHQYRRSAWAVGNMKGKQDAAAQPGPEGEKYSWAKLVPAMDQKAADEACLRTALAGLKDKVAAVRASAVDVLTWVHDGPLEEVKPLAADEDPGVRTAVQGYMTRFGGQSWAADILIKSLQDPSEKVRDKAVETLEHSPKPPPLAALKTGFALAKGPMAIRLLSMLYEQEDKDLPATLLKGFADRVEEEKLAILASVAGHRDGATLELAKLALSDKSVSVQRQGLLRLLPFAQAKAEIPMAEYIKTCPPELKPLAQAVLNELQKREVFGFLAGTAGTVAAATEKEFPSKKGTVPMVSPDGKWVGYCETGWGKGDEIGFGRGDMYSLVHVVDKDGKNDRIVSDMFLVAWMSDSRRIASSRDGYAAITDLEGNVAAEFGTKEPGGAPPRPAGEWTKGGRMPHSKRIPYREPGPGHAVWDYGENAAFSPDGKWFGPFGEDMTFLSATDEKVMIPGLGNSGLQATWSPNGRHVLIWDRDKWATIVDFKARKVGGIRQVDPFVEIGDWDYRKCRWNPWSHDGSRLAFLRDGQVWTCKPDGQDAKQVTWGARAKACPTFSPDGRRVAYLCYQEDNRLHYRRLGPTDLWVADLETGMETRVTRPGPARIRCLDWLDGGSLIFDRVQEEARRCTSALRVAQLRSQE
jgi:HEAT repeat protein